jgi:hypothetical protein
MAIDLDILKTEYLQNDLFTQHNRLVENLTQIQALVQIEAEEQRIQTLLRETQFFVEWIVPGINPEIYTEFAAELVELQRQLSRWKLWWSIIWVKSTDRLQVAADAQQWCDRLQANFALLNDLQPEA